METNEWSNNNFKWNVLLINNYNSDNEYEPTEPRWLLSIHNKIKEICSSQILDRQINNLSPIQALRFVIANKFNVVWISQFSEKSNNKWLSEFISLIRKFKKDIIIVLWWFWPTFNTNYFANHLPDFLVLWYWEYVMRRLIETNFKKENWESFVDTNDLTLSKSLEHSYPSSPLIVITNWKKLDINDLDFHRPNYFFDKYYGFIADMTRWCIWQCIFCEQTLTLWRHKVVNKDLEISMREIEYLLDNTDKEDCIWLWWSNAFNKANNTIELIRFMEEKWIEWRNFHLCLRLDMIDYLIKNSNKVRRFFYLNKVSIEIWLETFDTEILLKLKKISKNNKNEDYYSKILK